MKARHLFARQAMNLTSFCDVGKLRTCYFDHITENVTLDLFKQLRVVRALYLSYCGLEEVPEEIGNLIHLRTLDLSYNRRLRGLPETIGELYNLQYLFLEGIELLSNASLLPKSLGKLINLQRLKQFLVEMGKSNLGMVKNLSNLGGDLDIMFNSAYSDEVDAEDAKLTSKIHITDLSFNFHHFEVTNDVFEALQAPQSVQLLCIRNFIGKRFLPNWLTSLGNLRELRLFYATEALSIPPLGTLPSLEKLYIMYF
ncbi:hypothetical protein Leryth_021955 [Lithospermum erythrorhizon]|nr:hypothetical protein Leryth_021955 [Lithospermum erythrorhizon]